MVMKKVKKAQANDVMFWILWALVIAGVGLYFAWKFFMPGTSGVIPTFFGGRG